MLGWRSATGLVLTCALQAVGLEAPHPAFAWGVEGHEIIALIAERYLDPAVRAKVAALLAADTDTLTDHDIASEATWADKYRDSDRNTTKARYEATWRWHFVDIELAEPDLASACFGHPPLPLGVPASEGPPRACVVDKIVQFAAELDNPATSAPEQLLALKFLLHLVGDLHQPLHAADDQPRADARHGQCHYRVTRIALRDLRIDQLAEMRFEAFVGSLLILAHQPRVARHIGGEDRGETAGHARAVSPVARRRPDRKSSRCSALR